MIDSVGVVKKKGRPASDKTKSPAERQRVARTKAHKEILTGDITKVSTSNLVSILPFFLSRGLHANVIEICKEIERRMVDKMLLQ